MSVNLERPERARPKRRVWRWVLAVVLLLVVGAFLLVWLAPLTLADAQVRWKLRSTGVKSRDVVVDGRRIHYLEDPGATGAPGGGRPVLLVHGLGARSEEWAALMPLLARAGFHVYAPDLLGYGRSDKPDMAYSIAEEENAMVGFLAAVGVPHADVVGWSMGGWVAMKLAADHPRLVDRLVLYDSAGTYFDLHGATDLFLPHDTAGVNRLFRRLTPHPPDLPRFVQRDLLRRMQAGEWVRRRNLESMTIGRDLMDFRLGEIHEPTLVMWGEEDQLIPLATGQRLADGIPGARFVPVPGCGHLAPAECAPAVARGTIPFLTEGQPAAEPVPETGHDPGRSPAVLAPH